MDLGSAIVKVDSDRRLVFGWAYQASDKHGVLKVDRQGDFIDDPWELESAAYDFVLESRSGDVVHTEVPASRLVESMVFTSEKMAKMGLPRGSVPENAWWVGFYVDNDEAWELVKAGKLKAFSIGGRGLREAVPAEEVEAARQRQRLRASLHQGH